MKPPSTSSRLATREYPKDSMPLMNQKWRDMLFLHWEYDAAEIQKTLPKGLYVDLFKGKAYIGIVPFFMKDVKLKFMPFLPSVSDFLELNVRTYVYDDSGTPGVWFYSLDANNSMAVQGAKSFFHLPYFNAEITARITAEEEIAFHSKRQGSIKLPSEFIYKGTSEKITANPESLDFFLIERYVLFADKGDNHVSMGRIHHAPYTLQVAHVSKWDNHLFELDGLKPPKKDPDHILFSPGVDVEVFGLKDIIK